MRISWRQLPTVLLAALVVTPLAVFAVLSVTTDRSPDQVRVSVDGVAWSSDLEDAYFSSDSPWEPGEVRTVSLWVRNDAPVAAEVSFDVGCTEGVELVERGALLVSAAVDDGAAQQLDAHRATTVVRGMTLESGTTTTLTLRAELVRRAGGAQVIDSSGIRFRVVGSGTPVGDPPSSVLAATDARLILAPLFVGLALIATSVLSGSRRRDTTARSEVS